MSLALARVLAAAGRPHVAARWGASPGSPRQLSVASDALKRMVFVKPTPSDTAIGQSVVAFPIRDVAREAGLLKDEVLFRGVHVAKVDLKAMKRLAKSATGSLVVVTGITPTVGAPVLKRVYRVTWRVR